MNLLEFCRKTYQDYVARAPLDNEFKKFLRTHERVPVFIDNLAREFSKATVRISKEEIREAVEGVSAIFVLSAKRLADERSMSPLARMMLKKKADDAEQFRKEAEALDKKGADHVFETKNGEIQKSTALITE